ncbi:MAG: clan AA aspartic protease [Bacteroidetes bacterium 4572_112]|nr:MAG: clan AA aspartic protease [Bacteroidetes bacterium 4572_112]
MRKKICNIDLELVPIEDDGFHMMVNGKINGTNIRLLIDTGASKSVFDKNRISAILGNSDFESMEQLSTGLGTNTMQSEMVDLKSFSIGNIEIKESPVVILDLSHVNESYEMIGDRGIDGVLGSDFLQYHNAVIYYKKPRLKLYY